MNSADPDQQAIDGLVETLHQAMHAKDATLALSCLADDALVYDLAPPLETRPRQGDGAAHLEQWFATWQGPIVLENADTRTETGGDVGYTHALRHMTGVKTDGAQVDLWFRSTMCARRSGEGWRITHIHDSVPFAMDGSGQALLDLKP